jgi:hypothetical protein
MPGSELGSPRRKELAVGLEDLQKQKRQLLTGINDQQAYLKIFKDHTKHALKMNTKRRSPIRTMFHSKDNQKIAAA